MQSTNENNEDKQKMEPSEDNNKPREDNYKPSEKNNETSENYGEENYKSSYDDEEKLIGLVEPNSKSAPPDYIDGPEALPDFRGSRSYSCSKKFKARILIIWLIVSCLIGTYCGRSLGHKYGNTKAVSDKIPCHRMSHNVEGVALGGEYMGQNGLGGHHEGHHEGHHASMGSHHQVHADHHNLEDHHGHLAGHDDSQYRPATMSFTIVFLLTLAATAALMSIMIKLLNGRNNPTKRSNLATQ